MTTSIPQRDLSVTLPSCGIDYIDGYSIKLAAPLIEDILLHLVNLSIETSQYPSLWKVNKVSPQFKKGDKRMSKVNGWIQDDQHQEKKQVLSLGNQSRLENIQIVKQS